MEIVFGGGGADAGWPDWTLFRPLDECLLCFF
jgi:hypothetical protein